MSSQPIAIGQPVIYREAGFGTPRPAIVVKIGAAKVLIRLADGRETWVRPRHLWLRSSATTSDGSG